MRLHIRQVRRARGLTQERLAEMVEMNPATISQLERDKHGWTSHTLSLMATALGVPEHEVLGYAHPPDAELPEATRELVRRLLALDEQGLDMVRVQVMQAEKMGLVRTTQGEGRG